MRTTLTGLVGLGIAALLLLAPMATASHVFNQHLTYEFGPYGDYAAWNCVTGGTTETIAEETGIGERDCDPTDLTTDESIDFGGLVVPGEVANEGGFTQGQTSVIDDIFGAGVIGGWLCIFTDPDAACTGQPDWPENNEVFCGSSSVHTWEVGDLHAVVVFINGIVFQTIDCDPTLAPFSTTGGVLDPGAGIYLTLSH